MSKDRDARFLKFLTLKILRIVEKSAVLLDNADSKQLETLRERHNLLFGSKMSLVENLVILAELLIKLNQILPEEEDMLSEKEEHISFTDADIALVNAFVAKQRLANANSNI